MKIKLLTGFVLTMFAAVSLQQASAQPITLTGTSYTNTFDGMEAAQSLPDGWTVYTAATATSPGNVAGFGLASYTAGSNTWANTTGRFANQASYYSYGSLYSGATNFVGTESWQIQTNEPNRCLAVRQVDNGSSTFPGSDPGAAFVLKLADTSNRKDFVLHVDLLNLDPTSTRTTVWTVDYGFGSSPTFFTRVALWTNTAGSFTAYPTNITFPNGTIDNSSDIVWIRIVALSATTGSGNRETFGMENLGLTWTEGTVCTPVSVSVSPWDSTVNVNGTATFSVQAMGTGPLYYQWIKNNTTVLTDGGIISGSQSPVLTLTGVAKTDQGTYSCIVSNVCGGTLYSATSAGAVLTVNDLYFASQPNPTNYVNMPGDCLDLFGAVVASETPKFQWRKNGTPIAPLADAVLAGTRYNTINYISPAYASDAGTYNCLATTSYGSTTSSNLYFSVISVPSIRIARWDFNNAAKGITDDTLAPAIATGTGTAARIGTGGTGAFVSGCYSDPLFAVGPAFTNSAWNTTTYPAQGSGDKTSGVQFNVSTVGYKDIKIVWQQKQSNTASKYQRFQYTIDGVNFIDADLITYNNTDLALSFELKQVDLSGVPSVNHNPNFGFRLVTTFAPSTSAYAAVSGNYGTSGTIRYDLMTLYGNEYVAVTPTPVTVDSITATSIHYTGGSGSQFVLYESTDVAKPLNQWTRTAQINTATPGSFTIATGGTQKFYRVKSE